MVFTVALACMPPAAAAQDAAPFFPLDSAWTADLGQPPAAAPAWDGAHVYVPLRDGTLAAVRLLDGETAWTAERPTRFAPAAADGSVVVAGDAGLFALRDSDGRLLWRLDFGAPISAPPVRTGGWLVAALEGGEVVALRAADGHEVWRRALEGPVRVRPAVGGRRLFVPLDDGRLVALELATGARVWERVLRGRPREILPLDALFVGATDNYMYRLAVGSGDTEWRWRAGGDIVGAPVVDEDRLFFTALDNFLWALDRRSGVQRWRRPLPWRPQAGPTLSGRMLFVSGLSESLRAFDSETGEPAAPLSAPGEIDAPPHLPAPDAESGLRLVFVVADGTVVGMRPAAGPPTVPLDFPPPPLLPVPATFEPADVLPFEPPAELPGAG